MILKQARQVITYATVSLVIYCIVSLLMYSHSHTPLLSPEVIDHVGIAIALYLVAAILIALNQRFSIYLMLFVILIYSIALLAAFVEINLHGNAGPFFKLIVDVLSVIGLVMNILCIIAAVRQRNNYISPKLKSKLRKK